MTDLEIFPLTPERWANLEILFGEQGAVGGCWCMWWRLSGKIFSENAGANNKAAFKAIVDAGNETGLLGYLNDEVVGWVSLAPRSAYTERFNNRSPVFKPLDNLPVWSILCFYVKPEHRGKHIANELLRGAINYARTQAIEWLEAIPVELSSPLKDNQLYIGTTDMFETAGFVRVGARRPNRPFMRLNLTQT